MTRRVSTKSTSDRFSRGADVITKDGKTGVVIKLYPASMTAPDRIMVATGIGALADIDIWPVADCEVML
jgi:hypothetical protein